MSAIQHSCFLIRGDGVVSGSWAVAELILRVGVVEDTNSTKGFWMGLVKLLPCCFSETLWEDSFSPVPKKKVGEQLSVWGVCRMEGFGPTCSWPMYHGNLDIKMHILCVQLLFCIYMHYITCESRQLILSLLPYMNLRHRFLSVLSLLVIWSCMKITCCEYLFWHLLSPSSPSPLEIIWENTLQYYVPQAFKEYRNTAWSLLKQAATR